MTLVRLMVFLVAAAVAAEPEGWLQINAAAGTRVLVDGEFMGVTAPVPMAAVAEEELLLDEAFGEEPAMVDQVEGDAFDAFDGPGEAAFEPVEPARGPAPVENEDPLGGDWGEAATVETTELPAEAPAYLVVGPLSAGKHLVRTELVGRPSREEQVEVKAAVVTLITVPAEGIDMEIVEDGPEAELKIESKTGTLEVVSLPIESFVQLGELEPALKSKPLWRAEAMPAGEILVTVIGMDGATVVDTVTVPAGGRVRLLADLRTGVMRDLTAESAAQTWLAAQQGEAVVLPDGQKLLPYYSLPSPDGSLDRFWMAEQEEPETALRMMNPIDNSDLESLEAARSISRDEAIAYCEWLTARAREQSAIPPGWKLQLPSKDQWLVAAKTEDGGWQKMFGGVAEWTSDTEAGLAVILGGSDRDASEMARGTDGSPGRRARPTDKLSDVGFRIVLVPAEVSY